MKKYWMRILPLFCLAALLCATPAAADARPVPLNCHEMAEVFFGGRDEAQLLGASGSPEEAALSDYFTAREAAYRGDTRLLSGDGDWNASAAVADGNELRAAQVRDMERRLGINVLDADVTTRVDRAETVRNPDGTLTLYVYEWTFYDYDDLADGAGGQDVSGFGTWHILTVRGRPDGSCEILSDEYDESDVLGVNTLSAEHTQALLERADNGHDAPETESASLLALSYYPDYDVSKAVAYAEQYWGGKPGETYKEGGTQSGEDYYNKAYASFNPYGGDCANFTSQCIYAGGMPQVVTKAYGNDGWYYKTSTNRSATWTGATNLRQWMADNRGHLVNLVTYDKDTQKSSTANNAKNNVFAGSPVFYSTKADGSFQHAVLCVGTNSAGTPVINSHNTNRWHALWSYYTGSKVIDTVQLTSKSFGSFGGYMKLADDFHAYIVNSSLPSVESVTRYVTNDGGGAVTSRDKAQEEKVSGQIWRFRLQDDGSYKILSALNGEDSPALAAQGNGWASRTAVCTEPYQDQPGQQWYLYQYGTAADGKTPLYNFRPKCSDRVMDIMEENTAEGTALWIFSRNGTGAQLFEIQETDWVSIDKPTLRVAEGGTNGANITFSWDAIPGAAKYTLRVSQGDRQLDPVTTNLNSYGMKLQPGNGYQATLEAVSANTSSISAPVSFNVATAFVVTYDANGGENAPEQQMKMEKKPLTLTTKIPVYIGHTFASWNVNPNGIGASYEPGGVYNRDADVTLYARWTLEQYTVTLNPNGGQWEGDGEPVTAKVTYSKAYGKLPEPTLEANEFAGWYTEPEGGEQITEESTVQLKSDGTMYDTLYAHWRSSIADIDSTVIRDGTNHLITVRAYHVPEGILFACGYMDGQMVSAVSSPLEETTELNRVVRVSLDGDFDTIRVFALSGDEHRPACPCNVVEKKDFL
ncbi:MAG: amidase domain-containing protein [Oscillibacter sp.]|nr:amidase domain-containing protein [Oscillibacter sp.]